MLITTGTTLRPWLVPPWVLACLLSLLSFAGMAQTQGSLTSYVNGNDVVTQRNIEAFTGKTNSIQATANGQSAGNVLNLAYTHDKLGNLLSRSDANTGVAESFSYDALNRLSLATTLGGGLQNTQQTQVLYDAAGNIKYKSDVGYYHYDSQRPSRMTAITLDAAGWSGAIGSVTVGNSGSKALAYAFDDYISTARTVDVSGTNVTTGNGNLMYTVSQDSTSGAHTVRWEEYTSFNKIKEMRFGSLSNPTDPTDAVADRTVAFVYGPEHQRLRQTVTLTSNAPSHMEAGTTWYMNGVDSLGLSYEKQIKDGGALTEHKHYLVAGGESFALHTLREGVINDKPAKQVSYLHHDHLGSLAAVSNESGAVIERLAYDPWGKRRNVDGLADPNDTLTASTTKRGYTMHEHMDEMGVINMNGRVQDPLIARFLSADPYVQDPGDLQSHIRYAYVLNNPLVNTDPTGYWSLRKAFKKLFKPAEKLTKAILIPTPQNVMKAVAAQPGQKEIDKKVLSNPKLYAAGKIAVTAVASIWGAGAYAATAWDTYYSYQATGSTSKALKAGAITYGTSLAFNAAGDIGAAYGPAAQIAAHAGAGCISSVAQGGKCGHGAAGAVTGVGTGMVMGHSWASAVIGGGLGSVAAGGSFEDGAVMGAMGFAFNCLAHGCLNRIFSSNPLIARNGDMGYAAVRGVANGLAEVQAGARLTIDVCGAFAAPCRGAGLALSVVDGGVALYNEDYWTLGGIVAGNIVGRGVANSLPVQAYPSDSFRQGVGHVYDQAVSRGIQAAPKLLGE